MAKDNVSASAVAAPWFAFARNVIDELDSQSAAFMEQSAGQANELTRVAKTMREQATGISRAMLGSFEQMTLGALDATASWTRRGVA
jgi:hypothetical protein